jgi:hypothetical protein
MFPEDKKIQVARQVEDIHLEARITDARLRMLIVMIGINAGFTFMTLLMIITVLFSIQ